ncbi:MAG: hypothetical protein R3300_18700 [Candidatus Promineifilaceae bacterium]|nr:hypothetical protein [Candidatus Promineifilaceae bacterium]
MEKIQKAMMKRYKMFATLGIIIVLVAFLLSLQAAGATSTFFSVDKVTRESAEVGSNIVSANVARNTLTTWVPSFKFVGLGILLGAITMALGVIATTLRELGINVMSGWPKALNPGAPEKPHTARLFPMLMMMGWMVLIGGFIMAIWLTVSTVGPYWSNSIATVLNPAPAGSNLLQQLGLIKAVTPWLGTLRFFGMALLFTAITVALTVIIRTLQHQEKTLRGFIQARNA